MFSRRHPYLFFLLVFSGILGVSLISMSLISLMSGEDGDMRFGEKIGVIEVTGVILDAGPVLQSLKRFREAEAVKAIVVRVESPGGAVGPAQEIYREIRKTAEKKPVIASMGAVAASGGYYISAAADGIVANPGTITGSIGVIMEYTNFEALFEKIGLYPVIITSGKYKDMGSPLRKMTEDERTLLQEFVDTVHRQFVDDVAKGRGMDKEAVMKVADGRILPGETAQMHGLVDRMGNMADALEWAAQKGGIEGKIKTVYPPKEHLPLLEYLLDRAAVQVRQWFHEASPGTLNGGYMYAPGRN